MNNLLQAHAAAVENGLKWEEFEQCIPLTKSILLLHTFVEKQADQLVARVLSSSELACPLRDLLEMFLIPLSVRGHYPREEVVSEYGAPIWFNLLDAVVTNRLEHQTESFGFQFLRDIQIRFLNAAFLKCHYPSDTNAYFLRWSSEEREEWHKSRSELGDNFMMAYSHQYSMDWFNELHENLSTVIVSCEFDSPTFQWQGLEAMLFILRSIHDQVSYEVAHENKASFQCALTVVQQSVHLISRLQPVLLGSTIEPRCDEWATGHCLLSCTLFDILCEYPPTLLSSELPAVAEYPTHQWCGAMLHFILSTFNGLPHLRVHREVKIALLHSTLKFFQIFIQNLPGLEEHTDSIVAALDVAQQLIRSDYPSLEPAIWYIFGLLMSHRALVSSIEPVMYSQIDGILALCEAHASANDDGVTGYTPMAGPNDASQAQRVVATLEHSMQRLTTLFVEFFSGVTKALAMLEQCGIESRSLSDYWQVRRDASRILLFLMKTLPVTANTNENPEWINQFARLIQSGIRVCDPSSDRTEYASQILDCAIPIVEKILGEKSAADTPVLDLSWLLLDALLQEARQQNRPNGFSTCLRLLSSCFHLIESAVVHVVNTVITGLDSALSVDHFTASVIEHPISPFLLAPKAQDITEHLSVSADFLYRVFSWPITRRAHFADAPCQLDLFCLFEAKTGLPRGHCWKISLTVGLAGLCVPEWITVQSCIRLLQSLFTRLIANEHSELWDVLFTPDLLFQIHASLVVVFAKGTLPRRLVNKYAYLYAALSPIMPDKQFSLLHALVGATSVPPSWFSELLRESPHNQYIYYLVDQAVRRSTVAERGLFVHSVTRTATPVDQIKNAIDNFSNACAGYTL